MTHPELKEFNKKLAAAMDQPEQWKLKVDTLRLDERYLSGMYREAWLCSRLPLAEVELEHFKLTREILKETPRVLFVPTMPRHPNDLGKEELKVLKSPQEIVGVYPITGFKLEIPKRRMSEATDTMLKAVGKALKDASEKLVFEPEKDQAFRFTDPTSMQHTVDQIIELSNDIKRKERETGKVPNLIPVQSMPPGAMPFFVKHVNPGLAADQIVAVQPMTARSENVFMERNADGTQTMCCKPSTPYNWRYVLRPVVKLARRRLSGWNPEDTGATRRDGWD